MDAKYLVFNKSRETGQLSKEQQRNQGNSINIAIINVQIVTIMLHVIYQFHFPYVT